MSPSQLLRQRIERVGIVAKSHLSEAAELLTELEQWLADRGVHAIFEADTAALAARPPTHPVHDRDALPRHVDLVVVLGGDGTLLGMADRIALSGVDIPILGVNFGSLGFLTEITLAELYPSLEAVLRGSAKLDRRRMLRAQVSRAGTILADRLALNDVVVTKSAHSSIVDLSVSVGRQFLTTFRADGLIVASPTGSTAYNLAAGGPIVHPVVNALVLTPIAPHTLTNRPVVIPATSKIRIEPQVEGPHEAVAASFDGQFSLALEAGDVVSVSTAERPLLFIGASARSYFAVLREKLKWGG